jgi:hypothetical protein
MTDTDATHVAISHLLAGRSVSDLDPPREVLLFVDTSTLSGPGSERVRTVAPDARLGRRLSLKGAGG